MDTDPMDNSSSNREGSNLVANDGGDVEEKKMTANQYRDFSHVKPDEGHADGSSSAQHAIREPTFIMKMFSILSNPELEDIISWLPHGRSWRVHQKKEFEEKVIPLYFRHARYSSFMRQVNGWGFQRVNQGPDYNSYYHEMFLRGMPHLANKMRRLTNKDKPITKKGRKASNEDEKAVAAPDFYKMNDANPLPQSKFVPLNMDGAQSSANMPSPGGINALEIIAGVTRNGTSANRTALPRQQHAGTIGTDANAAAALAASMQTSPLQLAQQYQLLLNGGLGTNYAAQILQHQQQQQALASLLGATASINAGNRIPVGTIANSGLLGIGPNGPNIPIQNLNSALLALQQQAPSLATTNTAIAAAANKQASKEANKDTSNDSS